ncbi:MAG TPA: alpha/beta hydrolase [Pseudolabrys sp.]
MSKPLRFPSPSLFALVICLFAGCLSSVARADETVSIGGSQAVLLKPAAPKASVILMPGGDGTIGAAPGGQITRLKNNQLVRTRDAYKAHGLAVLVVDANTNLAAAVDYMRKVKSPVTVIGTSRGTFRAAQGIARGARPDALVLTSGFLSNDSGSGQNVENILGSPASLPRTLVIHHRQDGCKFTRPAGVEPFIKWAGGKARVVWVDGGSSQSDPCQAKSHHGFLGLDGKVVSLAAGFR